VTKPQAKNAAPPRKAAGKPAAAKKAPAKGAPAKKSASAKPAPKAAAKPAPRKPVKAAPVKTAPTKPPAKAASPKKNAAPSVPQTVAKPAALPVAAGKPAKPAKEPRSSGRTSAKANPAAASVPDPGPASRFADRFAPMRSTRPIAVEEPVRHAVKIDPRLVNSWKSKAGRDLTEAELFAMPDGEYMNEKQLEFFRARLTVLKDDLLSNAGETTEHLREDTSIVPDPADRATIEEEHALELRTRDRERKLLKKISQSLARIEAGDYGYCDETGEPIGLARLLARPTATLSLEAQQRREMKQKMFGD
jgi:DnaK suppressor protein